MNDQTHETEPGKAMLEHLKELLAVQRIWAGMVVTPNVIICRTDCGAES